MKVTLKKFGCGYPEIIPPDKFPARINNNLSHLFVPKK
jgi:hypothetical protein